MTNGTRNRIGHFRAHCATLRRTIASQLGDSLTHPALGISCAARDTTPPLQVHFHNYGASANIELDEDNDGYAFY